MDVKALSEILGHADVSLTIKRYVHPELEQKRDSLNLLSDAFAGNKLREN